jgi:hypothetical protein
MFLDVTPYCLVGGFQVFGTTCRGHLQARHRYLWNDFTSQKAVILKKWEGYSYWLAGSVLFLYWSENTVNYCSAFDVE